MSAQALLLRAEAALIAGQPPAAARWADQARTRFLRRGNRRQAALAALIALRARQAAAAARPELAAQAGDLAAALHELGLPEDARVAGLVTARARIALGAPGEAADRAAPSGPAARHRPA